MPFSLSQELSYSTVKIETVTKNKNRSKGTGYIFKFQNIKSESKTIIVTNNHVVSKSERGKMLFCKAKPDGSPDDLNHFQYDSKNFESLWTKHPDKNVDLCFMDMNNILSKTKSLYQNIYYKTIDENFIPNKNDLVKLSSIEDIIMVGYPIGLTDAFNNKPIFRKGITATHVSLDYQGRKEFLIDCACFPGSSGSPVLIVNESSYSDGNGILVVDSRIFLLGTLYAGPQYNSKGKIRPVLIPTNTKYISETKIPINLGLVIKSERLLEFKSLL
ncbi:S1 family peptidase [Leptospira kanakyensis]|uniref:S1 family peptidase n=1 Tax=Leptospira kanakyensis TaxID=2484968 RepID=UPI00223CD69A|nr:serine protease [Leptospira kanakyensis]MCW7483238.1 serine protease [Leptospira kanakyensis]